MKHDPLKVTFIIIKSNNYLYIMKHIFNRNLNKNSNIIFNTIDNRFNIKLFNVKKELISNSLFYNQSKNVETNGSQNNLERNVEITHTENHNNLEKNVETFHSDNDNNLEKNVETINSHNENNLEKNVETIHSDNENNLEKIQPKISSIKLDTSGIYINLNRNSLQNNINSSIFKFLNNFSNHSQTDLSTNIAFSPHNIVFNVNDYNTLLDFSNNSFNILIPNSSYNISLFQYLLNWKSDVSDNLLKLPYVFNKSNNNNNLNLINFGPNINLNTLIISPSFNITHPFIEELDFSYNMDRNIGTLDSKSLIFT